MAGSKSTQTRLGIIISTIYIQAVVRQSKLIIPHPLCICYTQHATMIENIAEIYNNYYDLCVRLDLVKQHFIVL